MNCNPGARLSITEANVVSLLTARLAESLLFQMLKHEGWFLVGLPEFIQNTGQLFHGFVI